MSEFKIAFFFALAFIAAVFCFGIAQPRVELRLSIRFASFGARHRAFSQQFDNSLDYVGEHHVFVDTE